MENFIINMLTNGKAQNMVIGSGLALAGLDYWESTQKFRENSRIQSFIHGCRWGAVFNIGTVLCKAAIRKHGSSTYQGTFLDNVGIILEAMVSHEMALNIVQTTRDVALPIVTGGLMAVALNEVQTRKLVSKKTINKIEDTFNWIPVPVQQLAKQAIISCACAYFTGCYSFGVRIED